MDKLEITKQKTVVTINRTSKVCCGACNSPTKYSRLFVVRAISVQEKPCGVGTRMRCEGLVDRAAWRMSGVDEVGLGSWSIFFFVWISGWFLFFFKLILTVTDLFGNKHNVGKLDFQFFYKTDKLILHI